MLLLIDNYDSFSYNLYQYIGKLEPDLRVIRNDEMTVEEIKKLDPRAIIISPGPGKPRDAGICEDVIRELSPRIPILGICLGHQAICEAFGAKVSYAKRLMHGKQSETRIDKESLIFNGLQPIIKTARYHSLSVDESTLPNVLKVIAVSEDGEVMAVEHREYYVYGLQFHPESIMTPDGMEIIENFVDMVTNKSDRKVSRPDKDLRRRDKMVIEEAIVKLVNKEDIKPEMAQAAMNEIMSGEVPSEVITAYLIALQEKGATIEEISASARGMRDNAVRLETDKEAIEIVGTGGDKANTFNISTASAIVVSAAGVPVAKHGNRAATSKCGTADCLEALGVNIRLEPEKMAEVFKRINICFMFAQVYHKSMKYVAPVRRSLPVPTVFNLLGPLTNPARPVNQLLGVYKEEMVEPLTHVLEGIGVKRAMTVFGNDGLDEISACGVTTVCELNNGEYSNYTIRPEDFGLESCKKSELVGGSPEENAEILRSVFRGEKGAKRTAVLMNAGAALHIAKGISLEEGIKEAAEVIDSGKAMEQLKAFVRETNL